MPPHNLSRYMAHCLNAEIHTGMASLIQAATLHRFTHTGSSNLALPIVVPIVVGVVLIVANLPMPKSFFLNFATKVGICRGKDEASARPWFGRKSPDTESSTTEKPQPTFVERHLEMLRAWQKPAQPPLPLYLAKPDSAYQPRRPTGMKFKEWQECQRNAVVRPNPMHEFKLTGVCVKGPAHWKKIAKEMEARKSWWRRRKTSHGCRHPEIR
ncbi:hypothetical protein BU25DRAFT_181222 [Macroventuria anomochaeta]|uniref:Uncharacterized protein n=1 Tax=Macroventuria anomochaeta TaxID=301207 RepID=A0ACB6RQ35_9PLEO|nr:uncharacterized protein BU25DRAFT_181222 [Macroventuria anomochaeta]KAF2623264.1 hypothetical protein BU25DRAFT_181222 [Macroventuria anomochaeta]